MVPALAHNQEKRGFESHSRNYNNAMAELAHEYKVYDLFPYKIQDRPAFYQREHPINLRPDSLQYTNYWTEQWKRVIEGLWVWDKDRFVFMFPPLYFYINIAKIYDTDENSKSARQLISPDLRDIEWIFFTYMMCTRGFSGFEKDEEYTCHETVEKIENKKFIDEVEMDNLPSNVYKADGKLKKYINAWDYLRVHYLIDNPTTVPLGIPLYDNPLYNSMSLTARGSGKSVSMGIGDLMHEFITGGIRYWADRSKIMESSLLFFAGSSDKKKMEKTLRMIKVFYFNMPGSYTDYDAKGNEIYTPSPFYRFLTGSWALGNTLKHTYRKKDGRSEGSETMLELYPIVTADAATGDRYAAIFVEEIGLLHISTQFHAMNRDSMEVDGEKVGRMIMPGTGGDIEKIQDTKNMYTNPKGYDIYPIPNYWENPSNQIGLFLPVIYKSRKYKDDNGNTKLQLAYEHYIRILQEKIKNESSKSVKDYLLHNPFIPSQIFHSSRYSIFPSEEATDRLTEIDTNNLFIKKATVGKLVDDKKARYGVRFEPDDSITPITRYLGFDQGREDIRGAFVMYEAPPEVIPKGLNIVVYDPVAKDGDGTSLHSVLVYKGLALDNAGMVNTIVGEYMGRRETLTEVWEIVYKIALYYNANIFVETNTPGFVDWIRKSKKHGSILESSPFYIEKETHKSFKMDNNRIGVNMTKDLKFFADNNINEWLLEVVDSGDLENGVSQLRVIDTIYSPRLLEEIAYYEDGKNYDHISALRLLVIWMANRRKARVYNISELNELTPKKKKTKFLSYKVRRPFSMY